MEKGLHKHHILPKHMGGTDEEHNISYPISLEDHIIWHMALDRMFPGHRNAGAVNVLSRGKQGDITGEKNPHWKGGKCKDMKAYRLAYYHDNKILLPEEERKTRRAKGQPKATASRGDNGDISGENNPHWKGGVCKDMKKYRREYMREYNKRKAA